MVEAVFTIEFLLEYKNVSHHWQRDDVTSGAFWKWHCCVTNEAVLGLLLLPVSPATGQLISVWGVGMGPGVLATPKVGEAADIRVIA